MTTISRPVHIDRDVLAEAVRTWFADRNFVTAVDRSVEGRVTVRGNKSGAARTALAADRALVVSIANLSSPTRTVVEVRQGDWSKNIAANVGWFVFTGGSNVLVSGWSLKIQKDLERYIRQVVAELPALVPAP